MSGAHLLIRCDASPAIGTGHVMRCMLLADMLAARGVACVFASCDESIAAVPGFSAYARISPDAWQDARSDSILIDHYALGVDEHQVFRDAGLPVIVLDDLCNRPLLADMLLAQNLAFDAGDYAGLIPDGCQILDAPEYMLLRPEFLVPRNAALNTPAKRLLLFFGGADNAGLMTRALHMLLDSKVGANIEVDAVIGAAHGQRAEIAALCAQLGARLHVQIDYMGELMRGCDLALSCGGTAIWERLASGLPALEIAHSEWQVVTLQKLHDKGYLQYLGRMQDLTDYDIATALQKALNEGIPFHGASCGAKVGEMADKLAAWIGSRA